MPNGLLDRADNGTLTAADLAWLQPHFAGFTFGPDDDAQAGTSAALAAARSGPFRNFLRGLGATGTVGGTADTKTGTDDVEDVEDPDVYTGSPNVEDTETGTETGDTGTETGDSGTDTDTDTAPDAFTGFEGLLFRADNGTLTAADLAWLQPYFEGFDFSTDGDAQSGNSAALGAARSAPFRSFLRSLGATGASGGTADTKTGTTTTETGDFTGFEGLLDRADNGTLTASDLAWLQPHFEGFDFDPADDEQAGTSASLGAARSAPFRNFLRGLGATGAVGGTADTKTGTTTTKTGTTTTDADAAAASAKTGTNTVTDTTGPWTQPPDSPLFNPPATQGPPSMVYGTGQGGGAGTMGNMITPYNPLATYSPVPYVTADPFARDPYAAADPFTGPTAEEMTEDPGYQFRLRQGQEALERSGAARGVTNTGGTLRDIMDYGQRSASQEYGNVFSRQRDVYDLNERNRFDAYTTNYRNAMDAYNLNERNRYQGYTTNELARWQENQEAENRRSGAYTTNLGGYERQQQYGLRAQGQGFNQAFQNWQEQYNQGRMNAQDTYNRMYGLSTA
jgi:hypothetical protein